MKKIFESELNGLYDYSAEKLHVYALESNDEWWEFEDMTEEEMCDYFGVVDEYNVAPGARYKQYDFKLTSTHIIMVETIAYNV